MPHPARIAYLTGEYPAISHTFILREVLALRARGLEVRTCSIRRTAAAQHRGPDEKQAAASTFHVLDAAKRPGTLLAALGWALARPGRFGRMIRLALKTRPAGIKATIWQIFYLIEAMVLARHLDRAGITRLHNHFAMASSTVAMLASELSGIPYSFTLHGPADFWETGRWHLGEKIARARFVACISHFCRSQGMLFSDPAHWERLHIVHCGVDPDRYDPAHIRDPGREAGRNVLFIGRLAAAKGVPILLDAFARLHAAHPDARLTLVGDGPARPVLEARARDLLAAEEPALMAGDYNIIPQDEDAKRPEVWQEDALARPESRAAFRRIVNLGFTEAFRARTRGPGHYSFWDYQAGAWNRDDGIRIDHFLLTPQCADLLIDCKIDKDIRAREKPSDHVPVWAELAL